MHYGRMVCTTVGGARCVVSGLSKPTRSEGREYQSICSGSGIDSCNLHPRHSATKNSRSLVPQPRITCCYLQVRIQDSERLLWLQCTQGVQYQSKNLLYLQLSSQDSMLISAFLEGDARTELSKRHDSIRRRFPPRRRLPGTCNVHLWTVKYGWMEILGWHLYLHKLLQSRRTLRKQRVQSFSWRNSEAASNLSRHMKTHVTWSSHMHSGEGFVKGMEVVAAFIKPWFWLLQFSLPETMEVSKENRSCREQHHPVRSSKSIEYKSAPDL